jgi:exonuclease SbcD
MKTDMRLIHTADWHLGQTLHGVSREYEHRCFLLWLLDVMQERQPDALLIAGDVFDSANPPASALAMFYRFIAEVQRCCPQLEIVVVSGNHDSPARLEAPQPLLASLRVHVVGTLPRGTGDKVQLQRLLVPLHNRAGEIAAWCAAVPFLRPNDLRPVQGEGTDPLIEAVRGTYREVFAGLRQRLTSDQALIATGHCYMVGGRLSELSERRILGGNQHALPADIFGRELDYAALGHLHLAQVVGGREHIRYSGSPIPLSLAEARYPHQVVQVDFARSRCQNISALPVPRSVEILRVPAEGVAPLNTVELMLKSLTPQPLPLERQPFLEVAVLMDRPEPGLRHRIAECLEGKPLRLLRISTYYTGVDSALTESVLENQLGELTPEQVFGRRYQQCYGDTPPAELLAVFHELLDSLQAEQG